MNFFTNYYVSCCHITVEGLVPSGICIIRFNTNANGEILWVPIRARLIITFINIHKTIPWEL